MENGKSRLQQAHEEVEEVKVIMLDNLNKADERSGRLGELENRADVLLAKSKTFSKTTQKVKQQKRWESMKMKVVLTAIGVVVAAILIGIIAYYISESMKSESDNEGSSTAETSSSSGN